ncbi:hypothetical protein GCM10009678_67420 [Actinomadura kijaniata]|uniref:Uncharacterized protein YndB with AHSA1/START domain n=1 Tax=Actinomadura namibiensis TaxID=182080 RepID=A0A7W3LV63_ACTNM|nr:SRPBCC domain-containing protein [Actinomadura namibiensis]MBA8954817.1 uncharacterized protein YndB with AHSA1/START domain [Actinomadura namibiensis]
MSDPMKLSLRVKAPLKNVHHALTDPAELRVWLAEHAEADLPDRFGFWGRHTPEGDRPRQRLLHADEHVLRFVWRLDDEDTTVELALEEEAPGATIVRYTQTNVPGWQAAVTEENNRALMHTFWALALANLADHLEGRPLTGFCDFTSPEMRNQVHIDAPPQAVYDSLMKPEEFRRWFGANVDIEPRVGGRFAMGGFDLDPHPATIVDLEPGRRCSLRWADDMTSSWELEGSDGGTRLTFVQSGFDEGNPSYGAWMGWLSGVAELRRYHEIPDWRPLWLEVHLEGVPEGMLSYE